MVLNDDEFQRDLDAWLAQQFAELPSTSELSYEQALDPYSSLSAASPVSPKALEERLEQLEAELIPFARSNPSPQELQERTDDILEYLQAAGALEIPHYIESALEILELLILDLAQSGQWELLDEHLTNMMNAITNLADPEIKLRWFKLWINHLSYGGLRRQLGLEDELRTTYVQAGTTPDETELKFLALIKAGNSLEVERQLAEELLTSISAQGNKTLLMRVHIMLAFLHGERYESEQLFVQAQKAYDLAVELGNVRQQISALNYMATAAHALGDLSKAAEYISRAQPLAEQAGDILRLMHLKATHGSLLYSLGQYSSAVLVLTEAAQYFPPRSVNYGRIIYLLGSVHIPLQMYSEAERILNHAHELFRRLDSYIDILNALLALAECYELWLGVEAARDKVLRLLGEEIIPLCRAHPEILTPTHQTLIDDLIARHGYTE